MKASAKDSVPVATWAVQAPVPKQMLGLVLAAAIAVAASSSAAGAADMNVAAEFAIPSNGDAPVISMECFGKQLRFLIDSTCQATVFDIKWRGQLGASLRMGDITGADNTSYHLEFVSAPPLKLGRFAPMLEEVGIADLELINSEIEPPVDGLIGLDVLRQYVVILDTSSGIIQLRESPVIPFGEEHPLEFTPGRPPTLPVRLGGNSATPLAICTNATIAIQLCPARFGHLRTTSEIRVANPAIAVNELVVQEATGIVSGVALGSHANRNICVSVQPFDGIGIGYLARFVVALDFPKRKAYVRRSRQCDRADCLDQTGLRLVRHRGNAIVKWVAPDSPAWHSGIIIGDVIRRVHDRPASAFTLFELRKAFRTAPIPISLTVTRERQSLQLTLAPRNYIDVDDGQDGRQPQAGIDGRAVKPLNTAQMPVATHGAPLLVPVQLDGFEQPLRMLVDTGASQTACSSRFRRRLGMPVGWQQLHTPDGNRVVEQFRIEGARIGAVRLADARVVVVDDFQIELCQQLFGFDDIDGILGMDLLRGHIVQIDFDNGQFRLLSCAGRECGTAVELAYRPTGTPALKATLGGTINQWLMVDTGLMFGGMSDDDAFDSLKAAAAIEDLQPTRMLTNLPGSIRKQWRVKNLDVGTFRHSDVAFCSGQANAVGLTYLARFGLVTFDFPAGKLYLKRGERYSDTERDDKSGIQLLMRQGEYLVVYVAPGSPANDVGIIPGDVLVAVNGNDAKKYTLFEVRELMTSWADAVTVVMRRNGERIELQIPLRNYSRTSISQIPMRHRSSP